MMSIDSSVYERALHNLAQIFNRSKTCYEFSKLGTKSSIFCCKVQNFEIFKKFFLHTRSTLRDIQNVQQQSFGQINYLVSRTKNRFCPIQGAEKGSTPLSPPHEALSPKFFCHNLGLGQTFETRLLLPETRNHDMPPWFPFLVHTLLMKPKSSFLYVINKEL